VRIVAERGGKSFYDALGLPPSASAQEIKNAYRRLASEKHPDRFASRPTKERKLSENEIRLLNEAYAVLSRDDRRKLYDQALKTGQDFEQLEQGTRPETPAEKAAREAADQRVEKAGKAAVESIVKGVMGLDTTIRWREEAQKDPYFDSILLGARGPSRYRLHVKLLVELTPEDIPGVAEYARAMLGMVQTGLIREQHGYLMVGRALKDGKLLQARVERFNHELWRDVRPRAPRALLAYGAVDAEVLGLPGAPMPEPDFSRLRLSLAPLFRV
jgi:DnaJ-domain-containing protein 1